ncbi:SWIM zinc finger family protein [Halorientalis marina]|uniref:SWIM zinc finger family protein n=1 Tax=Halorientalis marina TaxID=2931976 RepID=UPI001FF46AB4|nr:SWIM zinc finger family protein [Halorientalis marina]
MSQRRAPLAPDPRELDPRAARAWTEPMAVTPLSGGCYAVETDHGSYTVDVPGRRCTCPDHRYRHERCKHLRRVAIEINLERAPPPGKRRADCAACGDEAFVPETAEPPLCTDCRLDPGDVVTDRETGDTLVVRRVRSDRADEYVIEATGKTVAAHETNERYPANDLVVDVVYLGDELRNREPRVYAFPYSRLRRVEDAAIVD